MYLRGIVSSSLVKYESCDVSKNAVYTNVLKFNDWISEKTIEASITTTTRRATVASRKPVHNTLRTTVPATQRTVSTSNSISECEIESIRY